MAELYAEVAALQGARHEVAQTAQGLQKERVDINRRIEALLVSGWKGDAAQSFGEAWREWCEGADKVAEGLHVLGEAMQETLADIQRTDQGGAALIRRAVPEVTPDSHAARRLGRGAL